MTHLRYQQRIAFVEPLLRYKTLSSLIGIQVQIFSVATLEADIRGAVASLLPADAAWNVHEERFVTGAMAKYGLIDAEFTVSPVLLEQDYQQGNLLLQALHFDTGDILDHLDDQEIEESLAYTVLETIIEELSHSEASKAWLKLFLRAESHGSPQLHLPENYFPRTFIIEDACIANSMYVWFFKHFYL